MTQQKKIQRVENKKKIAAKNFKYNRFLMLRYLLAGCFFTNIYWGLVLFLSNSVIVFVPIIFLICILPGIAEHVKLYELRDKQPSLVWNRRYHTMQLFVNSGLILALFSEKGIQLFFPFIATKGAARLFIASTLLLGILISLVSNKRIQKINKNKDKHYHLIAEFEDIMGA